MIDFNRHTERLLLQYGVFVWREPDGKARLLITPENFQPIAWPKS